MKHSEFWDALESVYGSAYGRSLASDLILPACGLTAQEALAAGLPPREVWNALCDETDATDEQRWVYRDDPKQRRSSSSSRELP